MYSLCNLFFSLICDHFPLLRSTTLHPPDTEPEGRLISITYELVNIVCTINSSIRFCANYFVLLQSSNLRTYVTQQYIWKHWKATSSYHKDSVQFCHLCEWRNMYFRHDFILKSFWCSNHYGISFWWTFWK